MISVIDLLFYDSIEYNIKLLLARDFIKEKYQDFSNPEYCVNAALAIAEIESDISSDDLKDLSNLAEELIY